MAANRNLVKNLREYGLIGLANEYNLSETKAEHLLLAVLYVKYGWSKKDIEEDYFKATYEGSYDIAAINVLSHGYGFKGREWQGINDRHDDVDDEVLAIIIHYGLSFEKKVEYKDDLISLLYGLDDDGARELKKLTASQIYKMLDNMYGDDMAEELNERGARSRPRPPQSSKPRQQSRQSQYNQPKQNQSYTQQRKTNSPPASKYTPPPKREPSHEEQCAINYSRNFKEGVKAFNENRLQDAYNFFKTADSWKPQPEAKKNMALAAYFFGDMNETIRLTTILIDSNCEKINSYLYRARAYYKKQEYLNTMMDYKSLLNLGYTIEHDYDWKRYGDSQFHAGYPVLATESYTKFLNAHRDKDSSYRVCLLKRAQAYFNASLYDKAYIDYKACTDLGLDLENSWFEYAYCLGKRDDYEDALKAINNYIAINPTGVAYNNRGVYYQRLGKLKEALKDYETALSKGYKNETIENVIKSLKNKLEDIDYFKKAIDAINNGNHLLAYEYLLKEEKLSYKHCNQEIWDIYMAITAIRIGTYNPAINRVSLEAALQRSQEYVLLLASYYTGQQNYEKGFQWFSSIKWKNDNTRLVNYLSDYLACCSYQGRLTAISYLMFMAKFEIPAGYRVEVYHFLRQWNNAFKAIILEDVFSKSDYRGKGDSRIYDEILCSYLKAKPQQHWDIYIKAVEACNHLRDLPGYRASADKYYRDKEEAERREAERIQREKDNFIVLMF